MGSPVQIPDLPSATVANDADYMILRQGLTDYKVSVSLVRAININGLTALAGPVTSTDAFLVSRVISGTPTNFQVPFSAIGVPYGMKTWAYMSSSQIASTMIGWQIVPNTGDALIACQGGATYDTAAIQDGAWTQPTFYLNITQIPAHSHYVGTRKNSTIGSSNTYALPANSPNGTIAYTLLTNYTGGNQSSRQGFTDPNHQPGNTGITLDNTWRPFANVGNIISKII